MSSEITSIMCDREGPSSVKNQSAAGPVVALGAPHDLAAGVVADQREGAELASPADLVNPDLEHVVPAMSVKLIGADAAADPPDLVPVGTTIRSIVVLSVRISPGREPGNLCLEVVGEPAGVPSERDTRHTNPMVRACRPEQLGAELETRAP
jgi:hypothetical protein